MNANNSKTPAAMKAAKAAVRKALKLRGKDTSHLDQVAYETMVSHGYSPAVARDLSMWIVLRVCDTAR